MARVLIPIPSLDFDPTEVAVPWRVLRARGHDVVFATPDGRAGRADDMMLTGEGLDLWGAIPGLRRAAVVGRILRASAPAREAYREMDVSPEFRNPLQWADADMAAFDGVIFPGGHRARGMRDYLESGSVQALAVAAFAANKPVGAICHGVLALARSIDPATGRSVLHGRKTTALTWKLESAADKLASITRFWDPHYYRTYRDPPGKAPGYMSVEQEVARALAAPADFLDVPADDPLRARRMGGTARDSDADMTPGWCVRDDNYVSARWPGDAHTFADAFASVLTGG